MTAAEAALFEGLAAFRGLAERSATIDHARSLDELRALAQADYDEARKELADGVDGLARIAAGDFPGAPGG